MSSTSNYNAITNLVETVIDYLIVDTAQIDTAIVENLDCNVGVIDTLTSTTATLSSANIPTLTSTTAGITTANITTENTTTSNITNLNTNSIQANPNSSAIQIYTSHTGVFSLGNTSNTNGIRMNNKLQMATDKQIEITPTGHLACETIRGYSFGNAVSLYLSQTGAISFGNSSGGGITINDNTTIGTGKKITTPAILVSGLTGLKIVLTDGSGNLISSSWTDTEFSRLTANNAFSGNNSFSGTSTFNNTILGNTLTGTTTGSSISLFGTTTAGITIGGSSSGITLGDNVSLGTNDNLTLSGTGKITTPAILVSGLTGLKIVLTDGSGNLISSSWTDTEFSRLTANNAFSGNNSFSGTSTFNNTLLGNTLTGTTTGTAISLFGTSTSTISFGNLSGGIFSINPNTTMNGNLTLASGKTITLNATGGQILCDLYTGTATGTAISLFGTSTSTISLGNLSGGVFTINPNTQLNGTLTLSSGKNLTLSSTGNLICNTLQGTATSSTISLYSNITTGGIINFGTGLAGSSSLNIATLLLNGIITIGNSSFNPATNTGYVVCHMPLYVNQDFNLALGKNIITSSTSKVYCNVYTGTSTSSNLSWGESGDTGTLTIYKTTTFSGGNSTFGTIITNTISATATNSTATLFGNITNGSVSIAGALTDGNLLVGFGMRNYGIRLGSTSYNSATDTGYIDLLLPVNVQYNITMATTNKILCNSYQGRTSNSNVSLFTETSGALNTITIGNTSASSTTINTPVILATGKTLTTSTTGSILCPTYNSTSATQALTIGSTNTTANVSIATGLTTGVLVLGSGGAFSTNYSASDLYIQTSAGSDRNLYANTIRATTYLTIVQGASLYSTTLTQDIKIGAGLTTGNLFLSNLGATTGYVAINSKFRQSRTITAFTYSSFWNVATGSANNVFQSSPLVASAMPPIYANAQTDIWSVWESNANGEACFIAQNGETTIICNPCDQFALHFQDEDSMGVADGFKMDLDGVITTVSDRRLKRDINPIPVGSDLLDKLSLLEYINYKKKAPTEEKYYKNGKLRQKYQKIRKGLIAQDVKKIFPEVVEKEGEYHMMKYAEVDIYFNMGVQELIKRDKEKQVIIDDLTARLVRLEQILLNP